MRARALALIGFLLIARAARADVDVDSAAEDQKKAAQSTFQAGSDLYDTGRYEEAITAFQASYDIVASPNSLLMVARCLRRLERVDEAYRALRQAGTEAAQKGERYDQTREAAERELAELESEVGLLDIKLVAAPKGVAVRVGERELERSNLEQPFAVPPGTITVQADSPNGESVSRTVTLVAGSRATVELPFGETRDAEPPRATPPAPVAEPVSIDTGSGLRPWAYVAGGLGIAGLATFGIFGVLDNSKFSDLEKSCPGGRCPPDQQDTIDSGRQYQTVANVGLAVGAVGVGAGVALFLLSSGDEQPPAKSDIRVLPGVGSATVMGWFE